MDKEEKSFDLSLVWKALGRFWLWILIATVAVAALAGAATYIYAKTNPTYSAKTQYLVLAGSSTTGDYSSNMLAKNRAPDVATIVKTVTLRFMCWSRRGRMWTLLNAYKK